MDAVLQGIYTQQETGLGKFSTVRSAVRASMPVLRPTKGMRNVLEWPPQVNCPASHGSHLFRPLGYAPDYLSAFIITYTNSGHAPRENMLNTHLDLRIYKALSSQTDSFSLPSMTHFR